MDDCLHHLVLSHILWPNDRYSRGQKDLLGLFIGKGPTVWETTSHSRSLRRIDGLITCTRENRGRSFCTKSPESGRRTPLAFFHPISITKARIDCGVFDYQKEEIAGEVRGLWTGENVSPKVTIQAVHPYAKVTQAWLAWAPVYVVY
jgi:hypothetical protein